jgi:hypothetical protein
VRQALVEHHGDVGSQLCLNVRRRLWRQQVRGAVEVRAKVRALLVDGPPRGHTEHLIAAAVSQDRLPPADEGVEPAAARDQVGTGPQIEMVGVAEQDRGADRFEVAVGQAFHRALRTDRHERRRLHLAMRRRHTPAPRAAIGVSHTEPERSHRSTNRLQSLSMS